MSSLLVILFFFVWGKAATTVGGGPGSVAPGPPLDSLGLKLT